MVGPNVFSWSEPIQIRNLENYYYCEVSLEGRGTCQFGSWMQVDSAAPMPVPVQMRIPRLNIADACPTPAVSRQLLLTPIILGGLTKLELPSPHSLRWINH